MSADVIHEVELNEAERRIDAAERRRDDGVRLPTRLARMLLAFACLDVTPEEVGLREDEIDTLEGEVEELRDQNDSLKARVNGLESELEMAKGGSNANAQQATPKEADAPRSAGGADVG